MRDILVIDDIRVFRFEAEYARDLKTAEKMLFERPWEQVWFDHDLGLEIGCDTIRPLAATVEEMAHAGQILPIGLVVIHTANIPGREWLRAALGRYYDYIIVDANDHLAPGQAKMYWIGDTK